MTTAPDWNDIALLICTYGRVALLEEALFCALHQTVPVRVIVLNDCPEQVLLPAHPGCHIDNRPARMSSVGAKRNELLRLAVEAGVKGVCWLDDDDLATPDYVERFHAAWLEHGGRDIVLNGHAHHLSGMPGRDRLTLRGGMRHSTSCFFDPALGLAIGGYGDIDVGEDQLFLANAEKAGALRRGVQSGYIYRANGQSLHISTMANGTGLAPYVDHVAHRMRSGEEPVGEILVVPRRPNW